MIHSTVPPGQVNRATVHATVSEFWHVLSGQGQIWRRDGRVRRQQFWKQAFPIQHPGRDRIPYRCTGVDPLQFLCITMPPWPGDKKRRSSRGPGERPLPEGVTARRNQRWMVPRSALPQERRAWELTISLRWRRRCHVATSDPIAEIIGDYRAFAAMQRDRLSARGIDIAPYALSHLAVRVADWDLYGPPAHASSSVTRRRTARTSGTAAPSP